MLHINNVLDEIMDMSSSVSNFIEIEEIAEMLNMSKQAANLIVGNKQIWTVPPCGFRLSGSNKKRQWDQFLATREAIRINKLRAEKGDWKTPIDNRSYVMVNLPVKQFPVNAEIRQYLIEQKGVADYRAFA